MTISGLAERGQDFAVESCAILAQRQARTVKFGPFIEESKRI